MKSKREIILLGGVMVAVVAFLYQRLVPAMQEDQIHADEHVAETKAFIAEQQVRLVKSKLKPHETLMLSVLLEEIPPNPFARKWIGMISDQRRINDLSTVEPVLSYDGYIRTDDRYIALINDEDYEVGNKIEHVPLYIRHISSDKIDVENPNTVSESRLSIKIIPLKEKEEEL